MASIASPLSSGVQKLYDDGVFQSSVSQSTLSKASASQLNQLAASSAALQQVNALFGNETQDNVSLSSDATNALLQAINPPSASTSNDDASSNGSDYLTEAVSNALTNNINSAVNQFLPSTTSKSGTHVNVVG